MIQPFGGERAVAALGAMPTTRNARQGRPDNETLEASAADLFDPVDFERRLEQARLRREQVLEAKVAGKASAAISAGGSGIPVERDAASRGGESRVRLGAFATGLFVFGVVCGIAAAVTLFEFGRRNAADQAIDAADVPAASPDVPPQVFSQVHALPLLQMPTSPTRLAGAGTVDYADVSRTDVGTGLVDPATRARHVAPVPDYAEVQLRLYAPQSVSAEEVAASLTSLRDAGFSRLDSGASGVSIAQSNVRYFHAEDRESATQVAEALSEAGADASVRDFTHISPAADNGTIEIWMSGQAPRVAANPGVNSGRSASSGPQTVGPGALLGRIFGATGADGSASARDRNRSATGPSASIRRALTSNGQRTSGNRNDASSTGGRRPDKTQTRSDSVSTTSSRSISGSSPNVGSRAGSDWSGSGAAVGTDRGGASSAQASPGGNRGKSSSARGGGKSAGGSKANSNAGGVGKANASGRGKSNAGGNGKSNSKGRGNSGGGKGASGGGKGKSSKGGRG